MYDDYIIQSIEKQEVAENARTIRQLVLNQQVAASSCSVLLELPALPLEPNHTTHLRCCSGDTPTIWDPHYKRNDELARNSLFVFLLCMFQPLKIKRT
jgi:hypothetical protein